MVSVDPLIGATLGERWRVVRRIGKGAMGTIYEVAHSRLPRSFALKVLAPSLAGDANALARFRREAEVVASLKHANIVEIVDWEPLPDGTHGIIMELLRGEDLGARLRAGPLSWPDIARIGDEILAALTVAHSAGVIHRDLKPANIFLALDDAQVERVKLLDFGVSKVRDAETTQTGQTTPGTPLYMSPEQADHRPREVGPECDTWALGAILYEAATGKHAFDARSTPAILYRICHGRPDPLSELRPDAPKAFVELVERALSANPERRIADCEEFRRLLAAAFSPAETRRPRSRRRTLVLAAGALLTLAVGVELLQSSSSTAPAQSAVARPNDRPAAVSAPSPAAVSTPSPAAVSAPPPASAPPAAPIRRKRTTATSPSITAPVPVSTDPPPPLQP